MGGMGGGSKIAKKVMTYFMDGPLARQAGNERRVSSFCTVYATYVTSSADRAVHTGLCRAALCGGGSDPRRPTSKVLERD